MKTPNYFRFNWYSEIGPHYEVGMWSIFSDFESVFKKLQKRQESAIHRQYTVEFKYVDE